MAALIGTNSNSTVADLLTDGTCDGTGITSSIKYITDGKGTASVLGISTTSVYAANITFNGHTINTTDNGAITVTPNVTFSGTVSGITGFISSTLTSANFIVGNGSNVAAGVAMSGDVTLANTGAVTLATVNASPNTYAIATITVNGKGLVTSASAASTTGSGSVVLATTPTIKLPVIGDTTDATKAFTWLLSGATTAKTMTISSSHTNNRTWTIQDTTDTFVGLNTTDTLTNKTLTAPALGTPASGVLTNCTGYPGAFLNVQVFTSTGSNTYTPTAGTKTAFVELWGAGGGGGSSNSATIFGPGGGAGAYSAARVTNISGTYTISIGAGGSGQASSNGTAATSGGNTTFASTTIVAAGGSNGVGGSTPGAGGTVGNCTGTIKIAGGAGNYDGSIAGPYSNGGSSPRNTPVPSLTGVATTAAPANSGAGGGAGSSAAAGGAGGSGYAIVWEYS